MSRKYSVEERRLRKNARRREHYQNHKAEAKEYYQNNRKLLQLKEKQYYQENKEKIIKKNKEYRDINKEKLKPTHAKYVNNKRRTDINFKLADRLRGRLRNILRSSNHKKSGSAVKDLGCSVPELKLYLEAKFQPGMSWDNWSITGWHIDHIIPLDSFNLSNRKEFLKACHYTNLQPLWAEENLKKNNSLSYLYHK